MDRESPGPGCCIQACMDIRIPTTALLERLPKLFAGQTRRNTEAAGRGGNPHRSPPAPQPSQPHGGASPFTP
jgi:hypothetical protein